MTASSTKAIHTSVDVEIARTEAEVWSVVSDYATDTTWRKGITEMTPDVAGPPAVGTKVREVLQLGGRTFTTDTTVTEVGPGRSYRFAGTGTSGAVAGGRRVVAGPQRGTSVFTYDVDLEPTALPRLARPVMAWWLERSLRRDLHRLRDLVEGAA
jgi:hypothetical protein